MQIATTTTFQIALAALAVICTGQAAQADDMVGGGPHADFMDDTLSIPCVQIDNLAPKHDGKFYDVILERRGNSYNFELVFAEAEDPAYCQRLVDFSLFEDSDFSDAAEIDDVNGYGILVSCELRSDRSRISIDARNLAAGQYSAIVEADGNLIQSQPRQAAGDEIEIEFDSNAVEIAKGATPIATNFIGNDLAVYAEIVNEGTGATISSATALCAVK